MLFYTATCVGYVIYFEFIPAFFFFVGNMLFYTATCLGYVIYFECTPVFFYVFFIKEFQIFF